MASIELKNIEKSFGTNKVIDRFDIKINDGEFIVLVGPSGCGKSTLLRMISGLESVDVGEIYLDNKLINNLIPSLSENLCDKFLPQEINLEQLGGLSFKKGCFPGQEVIARVKYKGKLKKQLKQFISLQPYNGDQSFTHLTNSTGERLGVVVNTVKDDNNHLHILAVSGEGVTEDLFLDNIISVNPYG